MVIICVLRSWTRGIKKSSRICKTNTVAVRYEDVNWTREDKKLILCQGKKKIRK